MSLRYKKLIFFQEGGVYKVHVSFKEKKYSAQKWTVHNSGSLVYDVKKPFALIIKLSEP